MRPAQEQRPRGRMGGKPLTLAERRSIAVSARHALNPPPRQRQALPITGSLPSGQRLIPLLHAAGRLPAARFPPQRLHVAARASPQLEAEVMGTVALAARRPAVRVHHHLHVTILHLACQHVQAADRFVAASRSPGPAAPAPWPPRLPGCRTSPASATAPPAGSAAIGRRPPQVVDHLPEQGEAVQPGRDEGVPPRPSAAEPARRSGGANPGRRRRRRPADPRSAPAGGARSARAPPPLVQSFAVQPDRPSSSRISPMCTDQKLGRPVPSRNTSTPSTRGRQAGQRQQAVAAPGADRLRRRPGVGQVVHLDADLPRLQDDLHGLPGVSSKRSARGLVRVRCLFR